MDTIILNTGGYGFSRNDTPSGEGTPQIQTNQTVYRLTKPKTTVNRPVDGYRQPSSYNRLVTHDTVGTYPSKGGNKLPVAYTYDGTFYSNGRPDYPLLRYGSFVASVNWPKYDLGPNNVRMKLLNNIRGEVLDVAMVLAEMKGTAETLGGNLLRLARSLDAVKQRKPESFYYLLNGRRRDNRRPTDKFLRETAGSYLEWKYGIMPTVYDIEGACEALDMNREGSLFDNPPLLVARAVDVSTKTVSVPINIVGPTVSYNRTVSIECREELKARCDFRVSGEGLRGLNRYGIGLGTVATVLFDRTPFSFVLNMAVPIAELIKAWTALAGVSVVGYCETHYREAQVTGQQLLLPPSGRNTGSLACEIVGGKYSEFTRTAFDRVPMPLPHVRNPIKVSNMSTVLALFTQLRKPSP